MLLIGHQLMSELEDECLTLVIGAESGQRNLTIGLKYSLVAVLNYDFKILLKK